MTTRQAIILIYLLTMTSLRVMGQVDSSDHHLQLMNRIDSLSKLIDKKNPKISTFSIFPDSLAGEKVISVKEQHFKKISKYEIQTNKTGNRMDMKYANLYLYQDTLIQVKIFYNEDKSLWEKFYYKDNVYFYGTLSAHGMRFSPDGNDKKFIAFADWLIENKFRK